MNRPATALLVLCFGLLTTGAAMLHLAAGVIVAGVLTGVAGVMLLNVTSTKNDKGSR